MGCWRTIEHRPGLRILCFRFRHPSYSLHAPEMDTLIPSESSYPSIVASVYRMHMSMLLNTKRARMRRNASLNKVRRKGTEDAMMKIGGSASDG
jgi:hypothetical protein